MFVAHTHTRARSNLNDFRASVRVCVCAAINFHMANDSCNMQDNFDEKAIKDTKASYRPLHQPRPPHLPNVAGIQNV